MPDDAQPAPLAEQIFTRFLGALEAESPGGRLVAAALRECRSQGVIGDRTAILNAVRAAVGAEDSSET